jgi:hypothetical protein
LLETDVRDPQLIGVHPEGLDFTPWLDEFEQFPVAFQHSEHGRQIWQ